MTEKLLTGTLSLNTTNQPSGVSIECLSLLTCSQGTNFQCNDVNFKKCPMPTSFCVVMNAAFTIKHSESKCMQDMSVRCGQKIPSLGITVLHHSAQPRDAK